MQTTKVLINLNAIKRNVKAIRKRVGRGVKILACVKADAYGHGMVEVSRAIQSQVNYFGVASAEEGRLLRENGITLPILILGAILPEEVKEVVKYRLSQSLFSLKIAETLNREASKKNRKVKVHIEIDTGMGREGLKPEETTSFIKQIARLKHLKTEGIFTHFPTSDEADKSFTYKQIEIFKQILREIEKTGIDIPLKHTANSAAILDIPESFFNMVRPGIAIYGYYPSLHVSKTIKLEPSFSLLTKIVFLKELPKGWGVSYGRTYITESIRRIATLPIGYKDGYSRFLSNKGEVLIYGKRIPVVGRVCMDQTMVDVTELKNVRVGEEVVLIGKQNGEEITVEEIAEKIGTIPYEIVCMIGKGVPRVYINPVRKEGIFNGVNIKRGYFGSGITFG